MLRRERELDDGQEIREPARFFDERADLAGSDLLSGFRGPAEEHDTSDRAQVRELFREIHAVSIGQIDVEDAERERIGSAARLVTRPRQVHVVSVSPEEARDGARKRHLVFHKEESFSHSAALTKLSRQCTRRADVRPRQNRPLRNVSPRVSRGIAHCVFSSNASCEHDVIECAHAVKNCAHPEKSAVHVAFF